MPNPCCPSVPCTFSCPCLVPPLNCPCFYMLLSKKSVMNMRTRPTMNPPVPLLASERRKEGKPENDRWFLRTGPRLITPSTFWIFWPHRFRSRTLSATHLLLFLPLRRLVVPSPLHGFPEFFPLCYRVDDCDYNTRGTGKTANMADLGQCTIISKQ